MMKKDLEDKLKIVHQKGRKIIAIEGVYSMSGILQKKKRFFDLSKNIIHYWLLMKLIVQVLLVKIFWEFWLLQY